MIFYIGGKMSDVSQFGYPAFFAAEEHLHALGHTVFSPARRDISEYGNFWEQNSTGSIDQAVSEVGFDRRKALAIDLDFICRKAEAIYLLQGWQDSSGARAEHAAMLAVGGEVYFQRFDEDRVEAALRMEMQSSHKKLLTASAFHTWWELNYPGVEFHQDDQVHSLVRRAFQAGHTPAPPPAPPQQPEMTQPTKIRGKNR